MYKVLVAEDESLVRNGIVSVVRQREESFSICGCASNGQEALAIARQTRPDVIITDIMMPRMDGMEMLSQYCPQDPACKVIIMSGHNEFEYARQAVQLGVEEYLLKPVVPEQVLEALEKAKDGLDKAKNFLRNIENLRQMEEESQPLLRERFLQSLLEGTAGDPENRLERLALDLPGPCYCVTFLKVNGGHPDISGQAGMADMLRMFLAKVSETIFAPEIQVYSCVAFRREICLVSSIACQEKGEAFSLLNRKLQGLCGSLQKHLNIRASAANGSICGSLQEIGRCCREAEYALDFTFSGVPVVNFEDATLGSEAARELPADLMEALFLSVKLGEEEKALQHTQRIFARLSDGTPATSRYIKVEVLDLLFRLFLYMDNLSADVTTLREKRAALYERLEQCDAVDQLRGLVEEFVSLCCRHFESLRLSRSEVTVEKIRHYADTQYGDSGLNLDQIAATLFMSTNYLRQLFKSATGMSFGEYLTGVRMKKAAQLLLESERKVQEIAEAVGYENPQYFGMCFKKHYQLTPTDYREVHSTEKRSG